MKNYIRFSKTVLTNTNSHTSKKYFKNSEGKKLYALIILCLFYFSAFTQADAPKWTTVLDSPQGTFQEIQEDFNRHWQGRAYVKGQGYKQYKRWERLMEPRIYPSYDMTLPSSNYHNYMEWKRNQPQSVQQRTITSSWSSLGPFAKPTGVDTGVGRLNMVRFEPGNPTTMYVGAPDGGLWKSTNGGTSWATNTDFLGVIGVSDLAIDPTNTQIMYLATGDLEGDRRSIGVLKSTNGGSTWSTTGLSWTATDNYKISKLLMHPTNSSILLAATDGGVFRTTDGGTTWSSPTTIENFQDMEFKPGIGTNPNTVYAAGKEFWKSTDNGVTWTKITSGLPSVGTVARIAIGVSADDSDYVYLLIGESTNNGFLGMYRSTDSGATFSVRSTSPNVLGFETDGSDSKGQAFYDLALTVSPGDADFVTVGGINMWQSSDGGATWYILSHWDPNPSFEFVHADIHEINYLPGNNLTFFACGDGGISKTTDEGNTWTDISNNLVISQQTTIGVSGTTASHLVAGLQDIGTIYTSGSWSVVGGGDGEDCFIDRTNNSNIVNSGTNGTHELSTNGGTSFSPIVTGLPTGDGNAEFYSPIRQDPTVATRIYAGGRTNLYRSNNLGTSWASTGAAPFGTDHIVEFKVAPSDNTIIYALKGTAIAKSTNSGSTWTNITGTLPTGSAAMTKVTISDTDADKAWVTFSGYSAANKVYKTTDGGTNWINVSTGLPNLPTNTIVYRNGSATDEVYIGMDIGIYRYDNSLSSWEAYSTNLPNVRVRDLKIFYPTNKLRAATYGRGTWESDLAAAVLPVELISFLGKNNGRQNDLSWSTASEIDLEKYSIERSVDGENFEAIGTVRPESTNSIESKSYTFADVRPFEGINYYRLKIIDTDEKFEYSSIIVLFVEDLENEISLFPNPTTNSIEVKGVTQENVTIHLMDALGRSIRTEQLTIGEPINVSYLPNGTYFFEIRIQGEQPIVKRFLKQ